MINLKRIYDQIEEFHTAFKVPKGNVNKQLRHDMLLSEIEEFEAEIKDGEITVNAYKELCDIMYVAVGTLYLHDISTSIISESTMRPRELHEKFYTKKYRRIVIDSFCFRIKGMNNSYLKDSPENSYTINEIIINSAYLFCSLLLLDKSYTSNIFNELFDEVHASNMSKLDDNGEPIINDGIINPNEPIGKVLKSSNYRKANILPILQKHKIKEVS